MNKFKVKATFPYGGWIISKVYAIDTNENRFLIADYNGKFVYVNIEDCVLVKED